MEWEDVLARLVQAWGVLGTSFVSGLAGGWAQGRYQVRRAEQVEKRLSSRLAEVEKVLPRLDPLRFAQQLLHLDRFQAVVEVCSSIINDDPTLSEAFFLRGQAYARLHETHKALPDLRAAVGLGDRRGSVYLVLALSEAAAGNWSQVEAAVRTSIDPAVMEPTPNVAVALTLLGESLRKQGALERAVEAYQRCLDQFPRHTPAIDGKADALLALAAGGKTELGDLLAWLDARIAENPNAASTIGRRALAFLRRRGTGDRERAFADLEQCAALWHNSTAPFETAGVTLIDEAESEQDSERRRLLLEDARLCLNQALNRASASYRPAVHNWIAYVCELQGLYADAVKHAQISRRAAPHFPNNHMALCCAFLAAARWSEATLVARSWLASGYAPASLPTRVWMLALVILSELCSGREWRGLRGEIDDLFEARRAFVAFREGWRFEPARTRVRAHLHGNEEPLSLAEDVLGLLKPEAHLEEFRRRWVRLGPMMPMSTLLAPGA